MGFLAEHANYAYTIGLVGVFVGVCLAMSSLHYLVIKPISRQKRLERRLRKTEKDKKVSIAAWDFSEKAKEKIFSAFCFRATSFGSPPPSSVSWASSSVPGLLQGCS